jgi:excisionase family DNA binding protein
MPRRSARGQAGAYTIPAAARTLHLSEKTVRRLIGDGQLRALRVRGRGGKRGTRWLITPLALEGYRERRDLADRKRANTRWMARMPFGADLPLEVTPAPVAQPTVYVYGPTNAPVHKATLLVTFDEWCRFGARRPARSAADATAIFAELRRRCGLSDGAPVCLHVRFRLDPAEVEQVLRQVVRAVRPPHGSRREPPCLPSERRAEFLSKSGSCQDSGRPPSNPRPGRCPSASGREREPAARLTAPFRACRRSHRHDSPFRSLGGHERLLL